MWREKSADNSEVDMATDLGIHPRARTRNDKDDLRCKQK